MILLPLYVFSQKEYKTTKIALWTLEYFPVHYKIKPGRVITEKDRLTGKIRTYKEVDEYGRVNGISVEMQDNLNFPYGISYFNNGQMVYVAGFFPNSNKAYTIRNRNLDGLFDGPDVIREYGEGNTIIERKIVYKDGEDIANKMPNDKVSFNSEGLMDGEFVVTIYDRRYIKSANFTYKGNANNGCIKYLEKNSQDGGYESWEVHPNYLLNKTVVNGKDTIKRAFKIRRNISVANSEKYVAANKFSFLYEPAKGKFYPNQIIDIMKEEYNETYDGGKKITNREFNFDDKGLLTGNFKGECKINGALLDYSGDSNNGIITEMTINILGNGFTVFTFKKDGDKYIINQIDEDMKILKSFSEEIKKVLPITKNAIDTDYDRFNPWNIIFTIVGNEQNMLR
jgi:hypothetical protein